MSFALRAHLAPAVLGSVLAWSSASAGTEAGAPGPLLDALAELPRAHPFIESVQFEQGGAMVWEHFARASVRNAPHPLRSAGKSVLSAGLGAVAGERAAAIIQTPVWPAFGSLLPPADDARRRRMTFEDVITMRSGHACRGLGARNDPCSPRVREPWKAFLLAPMRDEPGTRFVYSDGASQVIAALLVLLGGKDPERLLREALFAPLGMDSRAGAERMSPADMRRFGALMLQRGCWNGRELIGRDWVDRSTRSHVRFPAPHEGTGYGYFWWTRRMSVGARSSDFFYAAGTGGQLIVVMPALDALLVITGNAYRSADAPGILIEEVATRIVPRIPTPREPDAYARCTASVAN